MNFAHLPRPWRWVVIILFALALLALLGQFIVYGHYAASLFRFPFDYDQGEGFELYDTVLHAQDEWPYRDSQVFPFYTSIYPPLFHLLTVPLIWIFGPELWTGRMVGFAASLIAAAAIGWGVYRTSQNRVIAVFSGLTFLASNYTFHIGPLFRQHMTMVMFETLAIVTLAQAVDGGRWTEDGRQATATRDEGPFSGTKAGERLSENSSPSIFNHEDTRTRRSFLFGLTQRFRNLTGRRDDAPEKIGPPTRRPVRFEYVWIGLIFLLAAGYTKQLALATALAGLAFLFLRGPRRALLAGAGLAVVAGAIFVWINFATQGWWYVSIIKANINAFSQAQALSLYRQWMGLHAVIITLALGRLFYEIYFSRLSVYAIWFAFAVANSALSGKFGAGESYFVTATATACLLSGIALAQLWKRSVQWKIQGAIAFALLIPLLYLVQTRLTLHLYTEGPVSGPVARALGVNSESGYYDSQGYTQLGPRPTRADYEAGYAISDLARSAPGPVFSEEAGFMFKAGKPVVTNAFPQLVMYQAGLFDPAQEIEMINRKAFGLVILRAQFYPPPVLAALGANYQPKTEIQMNGFLYRILEPRS